MKNRGYSPQYKSFDRLKVKKNDIVENIVVIDSIKLGFLKDFINQIDSSTLFIAVISPSWNTIPDAEITFIQNFCKKHGILLWNFQKNPKFYHHDEYFYNPAHLNSKGADVFTMEVIQRLQLCFNH